MYEDTIEAARQFGRAVEDLPEDDKLRVALGGYPQYVLGICERVIARKAEPAPLPAGQPGAGPVSEAGTYPRGEPSGATQEFLPGTPGVETPAEPDPSIV